jgi:uncharacterized protein YkwD
MPRRKGERRRVELLGGVAATLVSALVVSVFLASSIDRYLVSSNQYATVFAAVLVDLANGDRAKSNLHTLRMNPVLVAAAQAKANDMAAKSYFSHVSPEGVDPWHWFKKAGYAFDYAGENLAIDFSDSVDVEKAWMNSPSHRDNILSPNFTEIGIATAQGTYQGRSTTFVVQVFGSPSSSGVQRAITEVSIPKSPAQIALATSTPVLGTTGAPSTQKPIAKAPAPKKTVLGSTIAMSPDPLPDGSIAQVPLWARIVTSPRSILHYTYWAIAFLILVALGITTGFEIRAHHTKKAIVAGVLLSFILVMLVAANLFVFTTPTLTPSASMAAAAAF